MIEIILSDLTGVVARAEADDPEAALVAARTLWDDMVGVPYAGKLTLEFRVDGAHVYRGSTLGDVVRSLQGGRVVSRYRYLIEHGLGEIIYLMIITPGDDSGTSCTAIDLEDAKRMAAQDPAAEDGITWKEPPSAWQPDAIAVSQWLEDDVKENRDT